MKKRLFAIISIILCISTLFSLTGCTEPNTPQTESSVEESDTAGITGTNQTQSQTATGSETLVGIQTQTQSDTQLQIQTETLPDWQIQTQTQTQIQIQTDTQTPTETGVEIESDTQTETQSQTDVEIESESHTQTQTEKPTEKPTEKETEKETELKLVAGKTPAPSTLKAKTYNLAQKSTLFRLVGRVKNTTNGILFDHSVSTVEFGGYMTGDLKLTVKSSGDSYYTVFIDGKRVDTRFQVNNCESTITIANFKGSYYHTVRIVKQSEIANSQSYLKTLSMTGYLLKAPEQRNRYIEFYGDSLTAAYGNIGKPGDSNAGSSKHQDGTKSYAFLAAEKLRADCSILAMSGVGVDQGWTSHNFMYYFNKYSYKRSDEAFNFTGARVPDLVVIHLGANDVTNGSSHDKFVNNAKELINYIQNGYKKKMPIIWAYDPSEQVKTSWMQEVLDSFGGEAKGYYLLKLEWRSVGAGAGGHPSVAAHEQNCTDLIRLINLKKIFAK